MLNCKDCELCTTEPNGRKTFHCDPFDNIKEPECVQKWHLIRLDMLLLEFQSLVKAHQQFEPMHNKLMKFVQHEIDEIEDSESWRSGPENTEDNPEIL